MFYFTAFYGNKKSLLYFFYLTSYKVLLGYYEQLEIKDELPLNTIFHKNSLIWLHDFIAPFTNRVKAGFSLKPLASDDAYQPHSLTLKSEINTSVYGREQLVSSGTITMTDNRIEQFTYENKRIKITAICVEKS
jgi:hypothetical protein